MKTLLLPVLSLLLTAGVRPALAQDEATKTALQSANRDVQAAQTQVHQERRNYAKAVQTSGENSPDALAAKTRLDAARHTWHDKLSSRQTLRHQARRDMQHRAGLK